MPFFGAIDLVKDNPKRLAIIEATQSGEVVFTLLLGVIILKDNVPNILSMVGLLMIVVGMIINSLCNK